MTAPTEKQLARLPKWAQMHIADLELKIEGAADVVTRLENMMPWTEPGMEWFTLWSHPHPEYTIFTCSEAGTRPLTTIGERDRIFIGRGLFCDQKAGAK